jgi:hypothetical protein
MSEQQIIETIYVTMKLVMDIQRYESRTQTPTTKRKLKTLRSRLTRISKSLALIAEDQINQYKESALKRLVQEDPQRYELVEGFRFS